jgi:phospholipase C
MISKNLRWMAAVVLATNLATAMPGVALAQPANPSQPTYSSGGTATTTPIKHLVVIFQENVSFDHYFGTYPKATNPTGEPAFHALPGTPSVNGLTEGLLTHNQNLDATATSYQPFRLDRSQNYTCSQDHDYTPEQQAYDSGLMDKFPEFTASPCAVSSYPDVSALGAAIVMGYFDGNTVTGMWNYAQHFAIDDNYFDTNFGPSTPGAINVISGMTGGTDPNTDVGATAAGDVTAGSVMGDPDPYYDDCHGSEYVGMSSSNQNIGDLLNAKGISWGWFQGGFTPSTPYLPATSTTAAVPAVCATTTLRLDGTAETAYSPHHNPFEYYASTSNPHHLPPSAINMIGHNDQANHEYDLSYFRQAALAGHLPAVSYLKANRAQDGHPGNSSPLDEQEFLVSTINFLQLLPEWNETAVIITYDDSDGWYDHVIGPIMNQSASTADALTGVGACGTGASSLAGMQARCGYGPRLPFIVISPYAKNNFVDSTLTDQSSVIRFIEDNWQLPRIGNGSFDVAAGPITRVFDFSHPRGGKLLLNPNTGEVVVDTRQ